MQHFVFYGRVMKKTIKLSAILCTSFVLVSCHTLDSLTDFSTLNVPQTQYDAGRVQVGAYPPIPWSQIVDRLDPNFSVTSADALLAAVIPVTSSDINISQRSQSLGLAANIAGTSTTSTEVLNNTRNIATDGTITETEGLDRTRTESRNPSEIPNVTASTPTQIAPQANPTAPAATSLGVDPFLQYRNATALFQEIQLLNSYLESEFGEKNLVPFLFRTQISVQPFARQIPYDVYTELYINKSGAKIIPLIITDNNERSAERRLANAARQLELSVSALVQGAGVGANTEDIRQELRDLQAFDLNTAMLVGRSNERELVVRIGAVKTPNGEYAMSARNYDVSFLVLAPKEQQSTENEEPANKITLQHFSTMRHAQTGKVIPRFGKNFQKDKVQEIENLLNQTYLDEVCKKLFIYNLTVNEKDGDPLAAEEKECVGSQDPNRYSSSVASGYVNGIFRRFKLNGLNSSLTQELHRSLRQYFDPILQADTHVVLPANPYYVPTSQEQNAILTDNGSADSVVTLSGFTGLTTRLNLGARLDFKIFNEGQAEQDVKLEARNITVDTRGNITISFPSVSNLGALQRVCNPPEQNCKTGLQGSTINLYTRDDSDATGIIATKIVSNNELGTYNIAFNRNSSTAPAAPRLFQATILPLTAAIEKDTSMGEFTLNLRNVPCPATVSCPTLADRYVAITGYPIAGVTHGANAVPVISGENAFIAVPGNSYEITLSSLTNDAIATIRIIGRNAQGGEVGPTQIQEETVTFKASEN